MSEAPSDAPCPPPAVDLPYHGKNQPIEDESAFIETIRPARDRIDNLIESADEYVARVSRLIPHFPSEVIRQWLYEHQSVISDWQWLKFRSLRFVALELNTQSLRLVSLAGNQIVQQYRDKYLLGEITDRTAKIAAHFEGHGTWPVAPIMFHTRGGSQNSVVQPGGWRFPRPLHLVEGHHRLAVWYALAGSRPLNDTHRAWIMHKIRVP